MEEFKQALVNIVNKLDGIERRFDVLEKILKDTVSTNQNIAESLRELSDAIKNEVGSARSQVQQAFNVLSGRTVIDVQVILKLITIATIASIAISLIFIFIFTGQKYGMMDLPGLLKP